MELLELENLWKECDRKVAENNRLNKNILRKILLQKPEKTMNWMKIKSVLDLLSPLVFLIWISITDYHIIITSEFYIGLGLFIPVYIIVYQQDLKYFSKMRTLDLSDTTLNIKKKISILEKYKVKMTQIRFILMPIATIGVFLVFFRTFGLNVDFIIMIFLILVVYIASAYYRFKYSIKERFRILNKEIEEIERMEEE